VTALLIPVDWFFKSPAFVVNLILLSFASR
jgi:hypothetical protein